MEAVLTAEALELGYRKGKTSISLVKDISLSLEKGKLTCLLGPNGVGKSTLIKTLMGQLRPLSGKVFLQGKGLEKFSSQELAKHIAVVLTDKISTGNLTVSQLVALGRIPHTGWWGNLAGEDREKVEAAIHATHIAYLAQSSLSELSDGQLQKVMMARALAQDGEVLILDEPTAHLDLVNRYEIMHLLKELAHSQQKAILVVTHDLEIALETADEFWLMQCGQPLVTGTPEDLVIQGALDLLLPSDKLRFDGESGKIQVLSDMVLPDMEGPEALVRWLRLALKKNGVSRELLQSKIIVRENPFAVELRQGEKVRIFESIGLFLDQLRR